jgi:hypothetical protein
MLVAVDEEVPGECLGLQMEDLEPLGDEGVLFAVDEAHLAGADGSEMSITYTPPLLQSGTRPAPRYA